MGGECDDSEGYFVRPTVLLSDDPGDEAFRTEYFGPILAVHVYPDEQFDDILDVVDGGSSYALTGAVIADDRAAVATHLLNRGLDITPDRVAVVNGAQHGLTVTAMAALRPGGSVPRRGS